jgi:hypothetical protein
MEPAGAWGVPTGGVGLNRDGPAGVIIWFGTRPVAGSPGRGIDRAASAQPTTGRGSLRGQRRAPERARESAGGIGFDGENQLALWAPSREWGSACKQATVASR